MKKIALLILTIILISSLTYRIFPQVINPGEIASAVILSLKKNSFEKYFALHAVNISNTKDVIADMKKYLYAKGLKPKKINEITEKFQLKFLIHYVKFQKKIKNEFNVIRKTLKGDWNKVYVFSAGIESLHQKMGLLRCNVKIYIGIKNEFKILLLNGAIITSTGKIFLCDEMSPIKSLFRYNTQEEISTASTRNAAIQRQIDRHTRNTRPAVESPIPSNSNINENNVQESVIDPAQNGNRDHSSIEDIY